MEISFHSHLECNRVIATKFCTWHTTTVQSWHVQNFVAIWWPATELQQGEVSIEFELQANKTNLRDLIAATGLVILLKLDSNRRFFSPCDLEIWWMISTSSTLHQALCIISNTLLNSNWSYCPETLNLGQNWQFFSRVTLKYDGWPWKTIRHLFYATSSFTHHFVAIGDLKLELVQKCPIWLKIDDVFSHVTLKFDGWPWKI